MEQFKSKSAEQIFTDLEEKKTADQKWELDETIKQKKLFQEQLSQIISELKQSRLALAESYARVKEIEAARSPEPANPESPLSIELQQAREDANSYIGQINQIQRRLDEIGDKIGASDIDTEDLIKEIDRLRGENDKTIASSENKIF